MRRRDLLALPGAALAAACGDDDMPRFGFSFRPGTGYAPAVVNPWDLRQIAWSNHLQAYFDLVEGGASSTLSPTMLNTGSNPTLTLSGNLGGRAIRVEYPVGGARGTATYAVSFDGGYSFPLTGTTGAATVDLGGGTGLDFGAGTYTATTANHTSNFAEAKVARWINLLGDTAKDLDDTAINATALSGPVFDYFGVNCQPGFRGLRFNGSMLGNAGTLASTFAGTNQPYYMVGTLEMIQRPASANALRIWAAAKSGSANNSKNILSAYATGPTFAVGGSQNALRWGTQKLDNATGSVSAYTTAADGSQDQSGNVQNDWTAHVHEWIFDGTTFTHKIDGIIVAQKNWATGMGSTLFDRFVVGGNAFGASLPTNYFVFMMRRLAIYDTPPSNSDGDTIRLACA